MSKYKLTIDYEFSRELTLREKEEIAKVTTYTVNNYLQMYKDIDEGNAFPITYISSKKVEDDENSK